MSEDNKFIIYPQRGEIPEMFFSDLTGEPMAECTICGIELLHGEVPYLIEKSIRRYKEMDVSNTIFEIAICMNCHQNMRNELSEESMQRLEEYSKENSKMDDRRERLILSNTEADIQTWTHDCIFTGESIEELEDYNVYGQFIGNKMLFFDAPFIISGTAIEEMQELLSSKTKEELDDFMDKHVGGPPEFREILTKGPSLIV